jgi:hypothetical protein
MKGMRSISKRRWKERSKYSFCPSPEKTEFEQRPRAISGRGYLKRRPGPHSELTFQVFWELEIMFSLLLSPPLKASASIDLTFGGQLMKRCLKLGVIEFSTSKKLDQCFYPEPV